MNTIYKILLVIAVAVGLYLWFSRPDEVDLTEYIKIDGKEYELLKQTSDTVYLDSIVEVVKYKPSPPTIITEIVKIPADIDSLEVIKKYYSRYIQNDTIDINGLGTAFITDIITQNQIESREAKFDLKIPEITNTVFVKEKPKHKVFLGAGVGLGGSAGLSQIKAGGLWKNKKDVIYGLDIGVMATEPTSVKLDPYIMGSMYWKLRFGKK